MRIAFILSFILFMISCSSKNKQQLFAPQSLQSQILNIDITKDTTITTNNGALINIPKGSIQSDSSMVQLELKEAYTLQQMILAGLSTVAGNKILSSGGMFYLNGLGKTNAKIVKPIGIKVPTNNVNESMKLFSGVEKDGKLDWEKPMPFKVKGSLDTFPNGKTLFQANCASCHNMYKDATGPALANMSKKRSRKYLREFTNNWEKLVAEGDCQAIKAVQWSSSVMNKFNFKDDEIDAIYNYLDDGSIDTDASNIKERQDSCEKFQNEKVKVARLEKRLNNIALDSTNKSIIELETNYYNLEINNFGWHNIDVLLETMPGVIKATLDIKFVKEQKNNLKVYLVVPSHKIVVNTTYDGGKFKFEYGNEDGTLPLPNSEKAYIIASCETNKQFFYAKQEFVINTENKVDLALKLASTFELNADMKRMGWDGLDIKAKSIENSIIESINIPTEKQSKEVDLINYKINKIKNLKPKDGCECGNGWWKKFDDVKLKMVKRT